MAHTTGARNAIVVVAPAGCLVPAESGALIAACWNKNIVPVLCMVLCPSGLRRKQQTILDHTVKKAKSKTTHGGLVVFSSAECELLK